MALEQFKIQSGQKTEFKTVVPAEVVLTTVGGTIVKFNISANNSAEIFAGEDIKSCEINIDNFEQKPRVIK